MKVINILPKFRQQQLRYEVLLHSLWLAVWLSVISFALVFMAQFSTKLYLQLQVGQIKNQITQLQAEVNKQQNSDVKAQVTAVNNVVSDYNNLAAAAPQWSNAIKAFAVLPPPGIKITNFDLDPLTRMVNITGLSPTRDLVILLYNNILQDQNEFYGIDYPLENVAQPTNISFHFTFFVQSKLIQ